MSTPALSSKEILAQKRKEIEEKKKSREEQERIAVKQESIELAELEARMQIEAEKRKQAEEEVARRKAAEDAQRKAEEARKANMAGKTGAGETEKRKTGRWKRSKELVRRESSCTRCTSKDIAGMVPVSGSTACQPCYDMQKKCVFPDGIEQFWKKCKAADDEETDDDEAGPSKRPAKKTNSRILEEVRGSRSEALLAEILVELKEVKEAVQHFLAA